MTRVTKLLFHLSAKVVITCRKMTWRKHTRPNTKKFYQKILMKYGKGKVNWKKMNELERAIENLEDNTDDCCKEMQALRDLKRWPERVEKMS